MAEYDVFAELDELAELLADLSEEQRNALLNGELLARTLLSSSDFHRPLELEATLWIGTHQEYGSV